VVSSATFCIRGLRTESVVTKFATGARFCTGLIMFESWLRNWPLAETVAFLL